MIAAVRNLADRCSTRNRIGGIGPDRRFVRRSLLRFDTAIDGLMALRRPDTGRGVLLDLDTSVVPPSPQMVMLFPKAVADTCRR